VDVRTIYCGSFVSDRPHNTAVSVMASNASSIVGYKRPQFALCFCPKFLCEADVVCLPYHFVINPLKSGKTESGWEGDLVPEEWENVSYGELSRHCCDFDSLQYPHIRRVSRVTCSSK